MDCRSSRDQCEEAPKCKAYASHLVLFRIGRSDKNTLCRLLRVITVASFKQMSSSGKPLRAAPGSISTTFCDRTVQQAPGAQELFGPSLFSLAGDFFPVFSSTFPKPRAPSMMPATSLWLRHPPNPTRHGRCPAFGPPARTPGSTAPVEHAAGESRVTDVCLDRRYRATEVTAHTCHRVRETLGCTKGPQMLGWRKRRPFALALSEMPLL